jgi:hypothetical protein
MSEVTVTANKKLRTINEEFQENFPYLVLAFFTKDEWEKARGGSHEIEALSMNLRIRDIRTTKPEEGQEISIHGGTLVGNLENNFLKYFGIYAQVCYHDADGRGFFSSGDADKMALTELNNYLKARGYQEYPGSAGDGNDSVKTDQITQICRALHSNLCSKIPGLAPVAEYKHYARGKNVNAHREYYADIDDERIDTFYLEWDPEEEEMYVGFCVVPPAKNRKEFKKKLTAVCEKEGMDTYEYACFSTKSGVTYDTFLDMDESFAEETVKLFHAVKKIRKALG